MSERWLPTSESTINSRTKPYTNSLSHDTEFSERPACSERIEIDIETILMII